MSYNDFTPDYSFNDVEKGRPFRVWCQKVLPTIYDDSLSYYELLNKVVYILNECIDKINELDENVDELNKAYQQLVAYLNEYKNYVETRLDKQDENIAQLEKELDKAIEDLNKRMDNVVEEAGDKIQEIIDSMDIEQIINEKFEQFIDSPEYNTMIENKITQVIGESADLTEMENNVKSIKTTIGASDDEAGGLTTGSVMGKLNYLIKYGSGGGGGGGTSTATEALLNDVVNNIGKTSDEGATSATGTIFGKLNLLVKNLVESNFISDFTSRLTNIKTVVDKNNTGINTLQGRCANINTTVSEVHEMVNQQVIPNEQSLMQDVGSIDDKIGTASDSGSNTLFGAINSISSSGGGSISLGRGRKVYTTIPTIDRNTLGDEPKPDSCYIGCIEFILRPVTDNESYIDEFTRLTSVTFNRSGYLSYEWTTDLTYYSANQPESNDIITVNIDKQFTPNANYRGLTKMSAGYDYNEQTDTYGQPVFIREINTTTLATDISYTLPESPLSWHGAYSSVVSPHINTSFFHVDAGFTLSASCVPILDTSQSISNVRYILSLTFIAD